MNIYDFKVKDVEQKEVLMEGYKGKVLLIVNTATGCGFTPQYEGLEYLYKKYKDRGLEILDFPCNQFGNQALGSNDEIVEFCKTKYAVSFKTFGKIEVNGENTEPLFAYLKEESKGTFGSNIKWNFTKFLVDANGNVIDRFSPITKPEDIEKHIVSLLEKED
jgi:glutathione peroxidase